jgi:hypothetical protein
MGTNHVKVWANCLQTLEAFISSRDEADAATASAASHLKALTALGPCPKATWKKLVIDMQVRISTSADRCYRYEGYDKTTHFCRYACVITAVVIDMQA